MVNESLEVFCNRDDIIKGGDFSNLSIIKVKMGEENLVRIKIEKGKTFRDFFREFLQDLLNEYSEEYDNKLLEFWKTEKFVTEEKRSANPRLNFGWSIELTENGKEEEVFLGHGNTAYYFVKMQKMLKKMNEKKPNSKFADDLKNLMLECYKKGEESNEQNNLQIQKNKKEDNDMNFAE